MVVAAVPDKALDRAYGSTDLEQLADAPAPALAGISDDAGHLAAAYGTRTARDPGTTSHFAVAQALVAPAAHGG